MSIANNNKLVYEPINDDYEWIQYNKQLRIIHSVKDDMYQMKSIIEACESIKQPKNWFENSSTKELLSEFELEKGSRGIPLNDKSFENRRNLSNQLKGYYVHRLLVNAVAMRASPRYSLRIFKLLDEIASKERNELIKMVNEQSTTINEQHQTIIKQQPRLVPKKKENSYKYLIWKEDQPDDPDMILLHLVKRNCRSFRQVSKHFNNKDERWFYRDNLPIAMTPNEDIKDLVRRTLPGSEYDIDGSTILTYKEHLPILYESITKYFNEFQK
ncbi:hypothetical protein M9Y10_011276 [Tritrichomonas musculus]|uniref:KilA-N domain-containing protein n=1 Tax=Tritrichomonas musculus TaxID=1915356 RepID=A0ABR2IK33_9EUKA